MLTVVSTRKLYLVSIFSQTRQTWRTEKVSSLADAIRLVHGLETEFCVQSATEHTLSNGSTDLFVNADLTMEKVNHTLRRLIQGWRKVDSSITGKEYRLNDTQFFFQVVFPTMVW